MSSTETNTLKEEYGIEGAVVGVYYCVRCGTPLTKVKGGWVCIVCNHPPPIIVI